MIYEGEFHFWHSGLASAAAMTTGGAQADIATGRGNLPARSSKCVQDASANSIQQHKLWRKTSTLPIFAQTKEHPCAFLALATAGLAGLALLMFRNSRLKVLFFSLLASSAIHIVKLPLIKYHIPYRSMSHQVSWIHRSYFD